MTIRVKIYVILALSSSLLISNSLRLAAAQNDFSSDYTSGGSNTTSPDTNFTTPEYISDDGNTTSPETDFASDYTSCGDGNTTSPEIYFTSDYTTGDGNTTSPEINFTSDYTTGDGNTTSPEINFTSDHTSGDTTSPTFDITQSSDASTTATSPSNSSSTLSTSPSTSSSSPSTSPSTSSSSPSTSLPTVSSNTSSTTPPPTTTTPIPTPREPSFTGFTYFNFSILFDALWSDTLNNQSSNEYTKLADDTATSLNDVYFEASAPGYSAIIVDRFTDSSNYTSTSFGTRFKTNTFRDDAVIAYYRAAFTTDAAYTQIAAIQEALTEIQKDLVNAVIANYNTSDEYLEDTMAAEINKNIAGVNNSKSKYCNSSTDECQPYETCQYDVSYGTASGIACVPGCYEKKCTGNKQVCTYEAGLTSVCSCEDNYVWMGDSCVSVGLIIGLAVGIGVIVIAILIVILVMQNRKMKHVKSMPAIKKGHQWDEFDDVFSKKPTAPSTSLAFDEESAFYAADDSSPVLAGSSTLASSANFSPMQVAAGTVAVEKLEATSKPPSAAQILELTTAPSSKPADRSSKESLLATLISSDEFKNYRPSFAGVDPNKKFVLKRMYVDNGIN